MKQPSIFRVPINTPPRVPKGTPKSGGQFTEYRNPDGADLEPEPEVKKSSTKRDDKWSPSNIDWNRLEIAMIIEKYVEENEEGRQHSTSYDSIVRDNLPMAFEETPDSNARTALMDYYDIRGLSDDESKMRCGVCGHVLRYGGVLVDLELRDGVMVGFDCLETYERVTEGLVDARFKARNAAARAFGDKNYAKCCAENEGLDEAFEIAKDNHIVSDIYQKLRKYGSISEKQIALVHKIAQGTIDYQARMEERERIAAAAPDAPSGKQTVSGTVVSLKSQETYFGGVRQVQLKMLVVADEGWKVWSTVPASLTDIPIKDETGYVMGSRSINPGEHITFSVTLEPSPDDKKFTFGKRPTKAILSEKTEIGPNPVQ